MLAFAVFSRIFLPLGGGGTPPKMLLTVKLPKTVLLKWVKCSTMLSEIMPQVWKETWYQILFCQNVPPVELSNFTNDKHFVKIKCKMMLSCPRRRWNCKMKDIYKNEVTNDVIGKKKHMLSKEHFLKYSSDYFEQIYLW